MNEMYQQLAQKVYGVLSTFAEQNKFTLVLDASNQQNSPVLWITPSTDVTKAVVDAYNAKSGRSGATRRQRSSGPTAEHDCSPHDTAQHYQTRSSAFPAYFQRAKSSVEVSKKHTIREKTACA